MQRLVTLAKIIEALGPVKGERTLQKLVYLVSYRERLPGYRYNWGTYGPVSFLLLQDITEARDLGLIEVSYRQQVPRYGPPQDQGTSYWRKRLSETVLPTPLMQRIRKLELLGERRGDPRFLEVAASLDYLRRHGEDEPVTKLTELCRGRINPEFIALVIDELAAVRDGSAGEVPVERQQL